MVPIIFFLCVFLFLSCEKQPASKLHLSPYTMQMEQSDTELLQIAEDSRDTLSSFFRYLARAGSDEHSFCIKYPFAADSGSGIGMEHVWLTGIQYKNGVYSGTIATTPIYLGSMKKGDTVTFSADSVSDWMYIRGGKIIGGYSIKYLLEQIPEDRRSEEQRIILGMFE